MDDFDKMDIDAGVDTAILVQGHTAEGSSLSKSGVTEYRDQLVSAYHKGSSSLVEKLKKEGRNDGDSLLAALIEEVFQETDNLLGNHMLATENGDLRDASVISYKRAEVLEKAIKTVLARQQFDKEAGLDLDSPSMMVVFRYFLSKVKHVFVLMGMPDEQVDIFLRRLGEETEDWRKELKFEIASMREI